MVQKEIDEAETALVAAWNKSKEVILRPSTLGGLVGVGEWDRWMDERHANKQSTSVSSVVLVTSCTRTATVPGTSAGLPARSPVFSVYSPRKGELTPRRMTELTSLSYVTESYLQTPEGQAEAKRAKEEGSRLYLQAKEVILRPTVAGGLAGFREYQMTATGASNLRAVSEKQAGTNPSQRRCPRHCRLLRPQALERALGQQGRRRCCR